MLNFIKLYSYWLVVLANLTWYGSNTMVPVVPYRATFTPLVNRSALLGGVNDEHRLLLHLLRDYDRAVRPILNATAIVTVRIGITLTHIFKIDEKNQVLSLNIWLEQEWVDERFSWHPKDFGDIIQLTVPTRFVWTPDIVLYNNADDFHDVLQTNVAVWHDGTVLWAPPVKLRSMCELDVTFFPFDDQVCHLRFGSWIYDGRQVDVTNRSDMITMDRQSYIDNGEWQIIETKVYRHVRLYACCPDTMFPELIFTIHLRRRTLYYVYNIIIPCVMLSVLTLMQFWLPCESGEKITLGLTVLLAYSVFSFNIGESMPETSEVIPLVAIYIMCIMGISAASVTLSVIILNLHHAGMHQKKLPYWLKFFAYRILAPFVCWESRKLNIAPESKFDRVLNFHQFFHTLATCLKCPGTGQMVLPCPDSPVLHKSSSHLAGASTTLLPQSPLTSSTAKMPPADNDSLDPTPADELKQSIREDRAQMRQLLDKMNRRRGAKGEVGEEVAIIALAELLERAGHLLDKLEDEKQTQRLGSEWQNVARIFDQCFFIIVFTLTALVTISMLLCAPAIFRAQPRDITYVSPYEIVEE